jgi:hypothetical protein
MGDFLEMGIITICEDGSIASTGISKDNASVLAKQCLALANQLFAHADAPDPVSQEGDAREPHPE